MKKGQIIEGTVIRADYPDTGIVLADGREVRIRDAIPGQTVRARVDKCRHGKVGARLLGVLQKADCEVEPDCPHFAVCGGCSFRQMTYEDQLAMKEDQIRRLLAPYCGEGVFEGILASPEPTEYRNKMEFTFGDAVKGGPMTLGMHERGSFYDVVTADECRIIHGDMRQILSCVLALAAESGLDFYHRMSHEGYFRHLLLRRSHSSGDVMAALVTTTQADEERAGDLDRELVAALTELPLEGRLRGVLHIWNDSPADIVTADRIEVLYGEDRLEEEILGLHFEISPFSFFQTNTAGAEVLYRRVREYAGSQHRREIFDLYSGTGTIAQILSGTADHVTGVEIVPEAVEAARENARRNQLTHCRFLCGDVLQVVDELREKPDLIVLDPPRDGIHPKAIGKIIGFDVPGMIYISCKATSLVRDLEILTAAGYEVRRASACDLFPGTPHVETVVLLSRV